MLYKIKKFFSFSLENNLEKINENIKNIDEKYLINKILF